MASSSSWTRSWLEKSNLSGLESGHEGHLRGTHHGHSRGQGEVAAAGLDPDPGARQTTIENHVPWLEAAAALGCHSIRVNAASEGSREEQSRLAADGLHRLARRAEPFGLSVLVENKPGVLARVAGLFARRGFNIHSLSVGPTEHPEVSRMTVVVAVDSSPAVSVPDCRPASTPATS